MKKEKDITIIVFIFVFCMLVSYPSVMAIINYVKTDKDNITEEQEEQRVRDVRYSTWFDLFRKE